MGQKVNPNGFRVGVIKDWNTRWYASKKDFSDYLVEDKKIRDHLKKVHYAAGVAKIDIERAANKVTVSIHTARPGMLIGKGGVGVDAIKADVSALIGKPVNVNIMEVRNPDANAQLVAENIAQQLEKRISFRRAMKQAMQRAMKANEKGIKLLCRNSPQRRLPRWFHSPSDHACRHRIRLCRGTHHLRPYRRKGLDL